MLSATREDLSEGKKVRREDLIPGGLYIFITDHLLGGHAGIVKASRFYSGKGAEVKSPGILPSGSLVMFLGAGNKDNGEFMVLWNDLAGWVSGMLCSYNGELE